MSINTAKRPDFYKEYIHRGNQANLDKPICVFLKSSFSKGEEMDLNKAGHLHRIRELNKKHFVIEAPFNRNFPETLRRIAQNRANQPIKTLVILGHSSPETIAFNSKSDTYNNPTPEDFSSLAPDCKIFLLCCLTSKGDNSIAEKIARVAKREVTAPNEILLLNNSFFQHRGQKLEMVGFHRGVPCTVKLFVSPKNEELIEEEEPPENFKETVINPTLKKAAENNDPLSINILGRELKYRGDFEGARKYFIKLLNDPNWSSDARKQLASIQEEERLDFGVAKLFEA
jgi:hypothetical protein